MRTRACSSATAGGGCAAGAPKTTWCGSASGCVGFDLTRVCVCQVMSVGEVAALAQAAEEEGEGGGSTVALLSKLRDDVAQAL